MTLARAVVASRMAPRGLETPEACMIAILHGLEVGLTPLMALQRIAVIDGRPTIWGDGAMALVRASGLCKSIREWVTGVNPEAWTAQCEVLRDGERKRVSRTFSVDDAKRAGLWGKPGPWSSFPRRMLQMRARAFALRDVFADVLGGLYLREELEEPAMAPTGRETTGTDIAGIAAGALKPSPLPAPLERAGGHLGGRTRGSSWVRLRPPREGIRLRAPAPPGLEESDERAQESPGAGGRGPLASVEPAMERETLELLENALCCARDEESLLEIEQDFAVRLSALSRESIAEAERIRLRHATRVQALARGETA